MGSIWKEIFLEKKNIQYILLVQHCLIPYKFGFGFWAH